MKPFALLALALALLATGCATVPLAPPYRSTGQAEPPDRLVTQRPKATTATIVVARPGWLGTAVLLPLMLDGIYVGSLAPKTHIVLEVSPGPHVLALTVGDHAERHQVQAQPGQQYFYRVTVMPGAMTAIDAAQGQQAMARSRRAQRLDQ